MNLHYLQFRRDVPPNISNPKHSIPTEPATGLLCKGHRCVDELVFRFRLSLLMEFAIVNNYMGPVATKAMKGYSDEDLQSEDDFRNDNRPTIVGPQYDTFCNGREIALFIDRMSRFFFPFSFFILNVVYWTTFL